MPHLTTKCSPGSLVFACVCVTGATRAFSAVAKLDDRLCVCTHTDGGQPWSGGMVRADDGRTAVSSDTEVPPVTVLGHDITDLTRC